MSLLRKWLPSQNKWEPPTPIAPDPEGTLFYKIAGPKSGVTRNVVVDETGTIVFLTRLFEEEEFEAMKSVIDGLVD